MAAGKLAPRQKMINLMYLVFIAMLAMNIDREVLRSFEGVNESLQLSTVLTDQNNETFYEQITQRKEEGKEGYADIDTKATALRSQAAEAIKAIESVKASLMTAADYAPPKEGEETRYNSLQNTDVVNKVFFVNDNNPTPEVKNMIEKTQGFIKYMLQGANTNAQSRINKLFDFSDKNGKSWLVNNFYDQPMIAALTNLTKLEANIRTEEGNRVRDLLSNKLEEEIELKAFVPIVSAPKYVKSGEKFDVIIGFGAYDNSLRGSINLNGRSVSLSGGKGVVSMVASGSGTQRLSGSITYETPGGSKTEKFDETYEVVSEILKETPTGAVVMADKMNVVYRGVDNPMSGSVTGVDASSITLNASSGSLSRSGGGWIYKPGGGTDVTFTISGKTSGGKVVSKSYPYRIKNIPRAVGAIRGSNVLTIPASSVSNQVVSASVPDFLFPTTVNVSGFKVKVTGQPTKVMSGTSLRGVTAKAGDQVLVFDISATVNGIGQQGISPVLINVQ